MVTVICLPFIIGTIWIIYNISFLKELTIHGKANTFISVLVPLRNEEKRVTRLLDSLVETNYKNIEFILYDDDSTDKTAELIIDKIKGQSNFKLINGVTLPEGWKGKPHACFELAKHSKGEILLWIDADVSITKNAIQALADTMTIRELDAVSGFPKFINNSFLERLLTPLLHFFVHMHLPIQLANRKNFVAATAASGAFIAVKRAVYFSVGGHEAVKDKVIEDVTLFKEIKRQGYTTKLLYIADKVSCTMYDNAKETWLGFEKNCFKAFRESYSRALLAVIFYLVYFVLPLPLAIWAVFTANYVYTIPLLCIIAQRMISDLKARQLNIYSLLMPISALSYCILLTITMLKKLVDKKTLWKGREV